LQAHQRRPRGRDFGGERLEALGRRLAATCRSAVTAASLNAAGVGALNSGLDRPQVLVLRHDVMSAP